MNQAEWIALILCLIAVTGAVYSSMRFMVKAIMRELSPNGGSSLKDQVNRIENRVDLILESLIKK
jgi:hypothetical protein